MPNLDTPCLGKMPSFNPFVVGMLVHDLQGNHVGDVVKTGTMSNFGWYAELDDFETTGTTYVFWDEVGSYYVLDAPASPFVIGMRIFEHGKFYVGPITYTDRSSTSPCRFVASSSTTHKFWTSFELDNGDISIGRRLHGHDNKIIL